jgi:uncharacterized Zn-binding protein involved in type VI secretion
VGELIGSKVKNPNAGDIINGATAVFTGPGMPKAARMSDPVKCHSMTIAEGSESVFIERWNAARRNDETWCAGKINDGCESVLIGGNPIGQVGSGSRTELSTAYTATFTTVDWVGTAASLGGKTVLKELALPVTGIAVKGYGASGLPYAQEVNAYGGTAVNVASALTGKPVKPQEWADTSSALVGNSTDIVGVATDGGKPKTYGD